MDKYVYVIWGRVKPAESVWGVDGNEFFGECPLLQVFGDYETAKTEYLLYVEDAITAFKEYYGDDELMEQLDAHLSNNRFKDFTPSQNVKNSYQLVVSKKQDLDLSKDNDCIFWAWYAYNWDEEYMPSPILPCIYLEKRKVQ